MDAEQVLGELNRLGLTGYEARAYLALTRRDSFTAAEVARASGVPRQRIYDVLTSLVEKGVAMTRPGDVTRYAAEEPGPAIDRLIAGHRTQLSALERHANDLVDELTPVYRAGLLQADPTQPIEVLRSQAAIADRFTELETAVKGEILVFTRPPYAVAPKENIRGLALARKHIARSIYSFDLFDDPGATEAVRQFIEVGEEARVVPELPMKLAILDGSVVMFGMPDVTGGDGMTMMVVESRAMAAVLKVAFQAYWNSGMMFEDAVARHRAGTLTQTSA